MQSLETMDSRSEPAFLETETRKNESPHTVSRPGLSVVTPSLIYSVFA